MTVFCLMVEQIYFTSVKNEFGLNKVFVIVSAFCFVLFYVILTFITFVIKHVCTVDLTAIIYHK